MLVPFKETLDAMRRTGITSNDILAASDAKQIASETDAGYVLAGEIVTFGYQESSTLYGKLAYTFGQKEIKGAVGIVTVRLTLIDGLTGCHIKTQSFTAQSVSGRIEWTDEEIRGALIVGVFDQPKWNVSRIGLAATSALDDSASWFNELIAPNVTQQETALQSAKISI